MLYIKNPFYESGKMEIISYEKYMNLPEDKKMQFALFSNFNEPIYVDVGIWLDAETRTKLVTYPYNSEFHRQIQNGILDLSIPIEYTEKIKSRF